MYLIVAGGVDGAGEGAEADVTGSCRQIAHRPIGLVGPLVLAVGRFVCRLLLDFWRDCFSVLYQAVLSARHGTGGGDGHLVLGIPTCARPGDDAGRSAGNLYDAAAAVAGDLITGLLVWIVGGAGPLLVPSAMMTTTQRYIHIVEIMSQNVALGMTAAWLLRPKMHTAQAAMHAVPTV